MSDWEDDMYDDEEEEELSFEEDDDDDAKGGLDSKENNFDVESLYFKAKNFKEEDNSIEAIRIFATILDNEKASSSYVFKSIKQSIKIYENEKELDKILNLLDRLFQMKNDPDINLSYFNSSLFKIVSRIDRENYDSLFASSIFAKFEEYLSSLSPDKQNEASNKKLNIKVQLCIANCFLSAGKLEQASKILSNLEAEIVKASGSIKSTYHLDILAAQILLLLSKQSNMLELKRLTETANNLITGIPQPKILGAVNEGSGIVSMYSGDYKAANSYFQIAFKSFNDCGDSRRVHVLVKFILSSILSLSEVNPFQSSDFQGFIKIKSIENLMKIYNAFQDLCVEKFNAVINREDAISNLDEYKIIKDFIPNLKELFYTNYIIEHLRVFDKVRYSYFTEKLGIETSSFEQLLIKIYNMGLISNYKIDCLNSTIIKSPSAAFVEVNSLQYLENAFKYFTLPNNNTFAEFETKYQQLSHDNDDTEKVKASRDFPEMMDLDYEDLERLKYFDEDNTRTEENVATSIIENNNVGRGLFPLSKNSPPINIDKLKFETNFSVESLQKIAFLLFQNHFIKKDLTNDSQITLKLEQCVAQYIGLIRNSIPLPITLYVSYFDKMKDEKMQNEFNKLFNFTSIREARTRDLRKDKNIPDVIQSTSMNPMEPPSNPELSNDEDALLKGKEKKYLRLKTIEESVDLIMKKHNRIKIRTSNFFTTLEGYSRDGERHKKPDLEMSRIMISRLFKRQEMSADQSETTSLDNMSFDGAEDREDVF